MKLTNLNNIEKIWLYFANGVFLEAKSFGSSGTKVGEIVFNTSLTGYQEITSDPSYAGQFITFTMPEIGNIGVNNFDMESNSAFCKGVIVRNYNPNFSNYRATDSFENFLKKYDVLGITDIDTRFLTKMVRNEGAMMMVASTEISDKEELSKILKNSKKIEEINYIDEVSTKESYIHNNSIWDFSKNNYLQAEKNGKKIVVIDFGVKKNILNELANSGAEIEVIPNNFKAEDLITRYNNGDINGIFLSNGPGDPLVLNREAEEVKKLVDANIPMFAICLGHQMLSIANGYPTYKLKFGHHGGNHPIKNKNGLVEITAQNHNYNVPDDITEIADVTHTNLFDNTIEGLKYKDKPIFSIQFHPESSPGPFESKYLFQDFYKAL